MLLSNPFLVDPRVSKEAKSLVDKGHEVTVIVWDRKVEYPLEDRVDGVRIIRIHNNLLMKCMPNDLFRNPLWWRKAYKKGWELYKTAQFKFDVVHCHDLDTLQAGVWLKKKWGIKLIYDAHEIFGYMIAADQPKFIAHAALLMEKRLVKKVDHIITVNEPLRDYFNSISNKPITIVMNCKDLVSKEYIPPKNDVFTLSYIGVLSKSRMFPEIIDIIGNIKHVKFIIAGKKENLYSESKERSRKYTNVEFLGTIPSEEVIARTIESNAIICLFDPTKPNSRVGLPNKIFESMAAGRPVIVTKGLYYSKIIEREDCGLAVNYEKEEISKSIIELRDNPKLCEAYGRNALKAAMGEFNWTKQEEKLIHVYGNWKR
jgi:glycosyltransferase involved in cell wall biosynthesis